MSLLITLITLIIINLTCGQSVRANYQMKLNGGNYNRPVIGILVLPEEDTGNATSPSNFPASYVKFIESAGARVLPVFLGREEEYYKSIVKITNGMLFTGGNTNLSDSIYTESASIIWQYALQLNQAGDYYPLFGICQGFELFLYLANGQHWPLVNCSAENTAQKVSFLLNPKQVKQTKMFKDASDYIIKSLSHDLVTYNSHEWCLPVKSMDLPNLRNYFIAISKSADTNGFEFISIIEAIDLPFYGVQFHPEKPIYEPVISPERSNTPHSFEAILVGQYFANFFINEARKNYHIYPETHYYRSLLIYNYCPQYVGIDANATNMEVYNFV